MKVIRSPVPDWIKEDAITEVKDYLEFKLKKYGPETFASRHEIFGILQEEVNELAEALRDDDDIQKFYNELIDVAVAAIWGIASISYLICEEEKEENK